MLQGIKLTETEIKSVLANSRVIAVVGSSPSPEKDSYRITELSEIPEKIDIVNIFRRPEFVLPVVEEAIQTEAAVVWFQFGVGSPDAIKYGLNNELTVVNDRCIKIEHMRLIG